MHKHYYTTEVREFAKTDYRESSIFRCILILHVSTIFTLTKSRPLHHTPAADFYIVLYHLYQLLSE